MFFWLLPLLLYYSRLSGEGECFKTKGHYLYQMFELPLFYDSPTTKAVGSNFVTSIEPTALVVGE